jgi:hypothetical protein
MQHRPLEWFDQSHSPTRRYQPQARRYPTKKIPPKQACEFGGCATANFFVSFVGFVVNFTAELMKEERKTLDERAQMTDLERLRHSASHVLATAIFCHSERNRLSGSDRGIFEYNV